MNISRREFNGAALATMLLPSMPSLPAGFILVEAIYSRPLRRGEQPWPYDPGDGTTPDWRKCDVCYEAYYHDLWDDKPIRQFYWSESEGLCVCEHCIDQLEALTPT